MGDRLADRLGTREGRGMCVGWCMAMAEVGTRSDVIAGLRARGLPMQGVCLADVMCEVSLLVLVWVGECRLRVAMHTWA